MTGDHLQRLQLLGYSEESGRRIRPQHVEARTGILLASRLRALQLDFGLTLPGETTDRVPSCCAGPKESYPAGPADALSSQKTPSVAGKRSRRTAVGALGKPVRLRDKDHRKFVLGQPCLVCGRVPSDPHHLTFTQPRAMGRRVSDEFTVPICRSHHRELHRSGNEVAWWRRLNIDPLPTALKLWQQSRADGELFPPAQAGTQTQPAEATDVSAQNGSGSGPCAKSHPQ